MNNKNNQQLEAIAEQWVNIVLTHLRSKRIKRGIALARKNKNKHGK